VATSAPLDDRSAVDRNDPRLAAFLAEKDEAARRRELEAILIEVQPVVTTVLERFGRREFRPHADDQDDMASVVMLRLIHKLKSLVAGDAIPIEDLDAYVARLAQNTAADVLRKRCPEMRRLRRRVRRILIEDERLAIRTGNGWTVCGKLEWHGREAAPLNITPDSASAAMHDGGNAAEALLAIFTAAGHPVLFDELVSLVAKLWGIADAVSVDAAEVEPANERPSPLAQYESRRFLEALWQEVQALRPAQRAALLLNLRDIDGSNALALLVILEIATFDEIATALELTPRRLGELWSGLPMDDLTIASLYGLKRQQVINLRRAARERLTRRMR
jgi:DNA-directed RNA polymerase specialized sigma24 family protein